MVAPLTRSGMELLKNEIDIAISSWYKCHETILKSIDGATIESLHTNKHELTVAYERVKTVFNRLLPYRDVDLSYFQDTEARFVSVTELFSALVLRINDKIRDNYVARSVRSSSRQSIFSCRLSAISSDSVTEAQIQQALALQELKISEDEMLQKKRIAVERLDEVQQQIKQESYYREEKLRQEAEQRMREVRREEEKIKEEVEFKMREAKLEAESRMMKAAHEEEIKLKKEESEMQKAIFTSKKNLAAAELVLQIMGEESEGDRKSGMNSAGERPLLGLEALPANKHADLLREAPPANKHADLLHEAPSTRDRRSIPITKLIAAEPASSSPGISTDSKHTDSTDLNASPPVTGSEALAQLVRALPINIPVLEPPVFDGDSLKYIRWRHSFSSLIEKRALSAEEKISYLEKYVSPKIKDQLAGYFLLNATVGFDKAKDFLDERYGDMRKVATQLLDRVEKWPKIPARDTEALQAYIDFLRQCQAVQGEHDDLQNLNSERELMRMVGKLPDWMVGRWARKVNDRSNRKTTFSTLLAFLEEEIKITRTAADIQKSSLIVKNSVIHYANAEALKEDPQIQENPSCIIGCKEIHSTENCPSLKGMTLTERRKTLMTKGACFRCLLRGHVARNCSSGARCRVCGGRHSVLLHEYKPTPGDNSATCFSMTAGSTSCSMIIPVRISHPTSSKEVSVYAILDNQSDTSFIHESVKEALQLTGQPVELSLSTMLATEKIIPSCKIENITVRGLNRSIPVTIPRCYTRSIMPADRDHIPTPKIAKDWPHLSEMANELQPQLDIPIGLLIGYDCSKALEPQSVIPSVGNGPFAIDTVLGWGIIGSSTSHYVDEAEDIVGPSHTTTVLNSNLNDTSPMDIPKPSICLRTSIREIFSPKDCVHKLESDFHALDSDQSFSQEDLSFLQKVSANILQRENGKYEMPLPFKTDDPVMPDNESVVRKRLLHLKKRLCANEELKSKYFTSIQAMIDEGYAEEAPSTDNTPGKVWYVPHHAVTSNEKVRVVFDCSAQKDGISLNDNLLKGPDLLNNLVGILLRFRQEKIAFSCDIAKMFHQFQVPEKDRDFLRFLWWKSDDLVGEPIKMRMTVHLFGAISSPGCANFALKYLADDYETPQNADAANFIRRNFYVDDGLKSCSDTEEANALIKKTIDLCNKGNLTLHKFLSNDAHVLEELKKDAIPVKEAEGEGKVLGLLWNLERDQFKFPKFELRAVQTKREMLSQLAKIYDPLGFLSPVMLRGKKILQTACIGNQDWNSPVDDRLLSEWHSWQEDMQQVDFLSIPRCYKATDATANIDKIELHHFSDASYIGYAACSYLLFIHHDGSRIASLVLAKSRVSPQKEKFSIPRLELAAALTAARNSAVIRRELEFRIDAEKFWCDSKVVIGYIQNDSRRFHTYVANRVQEIRTLTDHKSWHYVPSKDNPADEASRGSRLLHTDSQWFRGPAFLLKDYSVEQEMNVELNPEDPEVRKATHTFVSDVKHYPSLLSRMESFSDWSKALRAVANCLKYVSILRNRYFKRTGKTDKMKVANSSVELIDSARILVLKEVQHVAFSERPSHIEALKPFLGEDQILRVGGRVKRASLPDMEKFPIILPKKHHITTLIIRHFHEKVFHQGRGLTLATLRVNGYWIINANSRVRYYIQQCVICKKLRGSPVQQEMADLPQERLTQTAPFTSCGMDCFGPFTVKNKRKEEKRYGLIFTCLYSRGVHIEMLPSLNSDDFIKALRRLIALRGNIKELNFLRSGYQLRWGSKGTTCQYA